MNDITPHKRVVDVDPITGTRTVFHWHGDGTFSIEEETDVELNLDTNKALYTQDDKGWSKSRDFRRVASIPNTIVHELMKQGINIFDRNDDQLLRRWLNDPENRYFRTAPGRV